ncbi:unnamed protein product [Alopecurus aequalis]
MRLRLPHAVRSKANTAERPTSAAAADQLPNPLLFRVARGGVRKTRHARGIRAVRPDPTAADGPWDTSRATRSSGAVRSATSAADSDRTAGDAPVGSPRKKRKLPSPACLPGCQPSSISAAAPHATLHNRNNFSPPSRRRSRSGGRAGEPRRKGERLLSPLPFPSPLLSREIIRFFGASVAKHCASNFHTELQKHEDYHNNLDDAVRHMFFRIKRIGSTACVAVIRGNRIIVGNVGHSRCVLSRGRQAMDLSIDHKPNLPGERQRIHKAGGRVTEPYRFAGRIQSGSYRVNGILAMSRAIGYFHFKSNPELEATEQILTCNPDVRTEVITADTEFLLIASDGIWNMLTSQGAVNFVHQKLDKIPAESLELKHLCDICEELLNYCAKSKDNSTVILVQFKPAAKIAPPAPVVEDQAPVVQDQPSASETSGAKADNSGEIKVEDEEALLAQ